MEFLPPLVFIVVVVVVPFLQPCKAQYVEPCNPDQVNIPPFKNLNMFRLDQKAWYVQERLYRKAEHAGKPPVNCDLVYTDLFNGYGFVFYENSTDIDSGELLRKATAGGVHWEENETGVWSFLDGLSLEYEVTVAFTNYDSYAVMHWCPLSMYSGQEEHFVILSGAPSNPGESWLTEMRGKVASLGYPTEYGVQYEHPSNCNYA